MKHTAFPLVLVAALLAFVQPLTAQSFDQIEVTFANLYSATTPTTVVSGTGTLGSSLVDDNFYWVCLDSQLTAPSGLTVPYHVSSDSSVLTGGIWGGTLDADARQGVITAATNMFYAYKDDILGSTGTEIGYGFQSALWGISYAYLVWGASGPLNSLVVDEVISNYEMYFDDEPWLEAFLNAALITPEGDATVYFANPVDDSELQPVMLFPATPVPEPSGALLLGLTGALALLRRRR